MNIEKISYKYAVTGKLGEELLYDYDGLKKVLLLCQEYKVAILGLEGFNSVGKNIVPNDNAIADFTSLSEDNYDEFVIKSITASETFLKSVSGSNELLWSVVLDDPD